MTGTLSILVQSDKPGAITMMVDDQFRWNAQKILWDGYKIVGPVIGVDVRGRLKKSDLNHNSTRIDHAQNLLIEKFVEMGFEHRTKGYSPAASMLRVLLGARLLGDWPKSRADWAAWITREIQRGRDRLVGAQR